MLGLIRNRVEQKGQVILCARHHAKSFNYIISFKAVHFTEDEMKHRETRWQPKVIQQIRGGARTWTQAAYLRALLIITVPQLSTQERQEREWKQGKKQGLECRGKQGSIPESVYALFRCLVLWIFCVNCSVRTLFSGDQLSQLGHMYNIKRHFFFLIDLTWFSYLNWAHYIENILVCCGHNGLVALNTGQRAGHVSEDLAGGEYTGPNRTLSPVMEEMLKI